MLIRIIMRFLNRQAELERLDRLASSVEGGLAVIYGRRRIGKTRLLVEWTSARRGIYTVADQSAPDVQRRYLAEAIGEHLKGFDDVEYPDWRSLLTRLGADARAQEFRRPIVLDELPYLVASSPELPSVLQRFCDHEVKAARLTLAIAGSSQRMMQGLTLSADAPLYGRAQVILDIEPLEIRWLHEALDPGSVRAATEHWTAWGGVPRYLELAAGSEGEAKARVNDLVLDPAGPLHLEPDRLLLEEVPSALEVRPVLDAIGAGAHRVSEIGARIGRPATSLSRPLDRLLGMGLVTRDVPFGLSPRKSRRSLYRIRDPFFRLWFRVVASRRAQLAASSPAGREAILDRYWQALVAEAWEQICRESVPRLEATGLEALGPLSPAARWWHGAAPEWDLVAEGLDRPVLLLGEAKWSDRVMSAAEVRAQASRLARREPPDLGQKYARHQIVRALFVPETRARSTTFDGVVIVRGRDIVAT